MRVYFNTNIYCRPFDDLGQQKIFNEAAASLKLFLLSSSKVIQIVSSDIVWAEISLIASLAKRDAVESFVQNNAAENIAINPAAKLLAEKISAECKLGDYADCLHLAFGCLSNCEYFVTCDAELYNHASQIESYLRKMNYRLKVKNPIKILSEMEDK